jgi:hypothetical protein
MAGMFVAAACAGALGTALVGCLRDDGGDRRLLWAAVLGISALLAQAGADYALRTPALAASAALLAGILIAQRARDVRSDPTRALSQSIPT